MIRNIVIVSACRTAFDKFGGVMKYLLRNHDPRRDRPDGKRSGKTGFIKGRVPGNDPVDDR